MVNVAYMFIKNAMAILWIEEYLMTIDTVICVKLQVNMKIAVRILLAIFVVNQMV